MVRSLYSHEMEEHPPEAEAKLRDRFGRRWPELKHVDFEYIWGGTTTFTMNGGGNFDPGSGDIVLLLVSAGVIHSFLLLRGAAKDRKAAARIA